MTNGEKLIEVFPSIGLYEKAHDGIQINFNSVWFNAEYKEPTTPNDCETCIHNKGVLECDMYGCKYEPTTKNDVPENNVGKIESTTKNDLAVDAVSRQALIDWLYNWTLGDASLLIDFVRSMPSVTPQESTAKNNLGDDYISRRAVIEEMEKRYADDDYITKGFINSLSSVTSRWIPVSEKLPNDRDWYLGIFKEPDTGWINPLPFVCDYVGRETKATTKEFWILRGFTDRDVRDCDYYFNLECVAWMPLPKAYSEVEE